MAQICCLWANVWIVSPSKTVDPEGRGLSNQFHLVQNHRNFTSLKMADENLKREASIPYSVQQGTGDDLKTSYGSMTARIGLFAAIFKDGADIAAGCDGALTNTSVKGHTRTRVIGKGSTQISGYSYVATVFPRKNVSLGKGGAEYRILIDGKWWKFRVAGRQQDFHSFLCQSKANLLTDVYYKTQSGASYYVNKKES